jgi:hypothetical protein
VPGVCGGADLLDAGEGLEASGEVGGGAVEEVEVVALEGDLDGGLEGEEGGCAQLGLESGLLLEDVSELFGGACFGGLDVAAGLEADVEGGGVGSAVGVGDGVHLGADGGGGVVEAVEGAEVALDACERGLGVVEGGADGELEIGEELALVEGGDQLGAGALEGEKGEDEEGERGGEGDPAGAERGLEEGAVGAGEEVEGVIEEPEDGPEEDAEDGGEGEEEGAEEECGEGEEAAEELGEEELQGEVEGGAEEGPGEEEESKGEVSGSGEVVACLEEGVEAPEGWPVGRGVAAGSLELEGGHHGDDEEGDGEAGQEGGDDGHGEVAKELPGDALDEGDGEEDGDGGEGGGDDGAADLAGAAQGALVWVVALLSAAEDGFEDDDAVVDEHAGAQGEAAERHDVEVDAQEAHGGEGADDAQGDGEADDEGAAGAAEEEVEEEDGQEAAQEGALGDLVDGAADEGGLVAEDGDLDVGWERGGERVGLVAWRGASGRRG